MRIITLTSIPSRFASLLPTLQSLLAQKPDRLLLWIPYAYRRFPDWDGSLPVVPEGVTISRCDTDLGPATKILPSISAYKDQDVQILFCDDDCIVPPGWAYRLFAIQAERPHCAVATYVRGPYVPQQIPPKRRKAWQVPIEYDILYRISRLGHRLFGLPVSYRRPFWISGYGEVMFGAGGVVVKPSFFDERAFDIPDICWPVDDIWLSAMLNLNKISIYCPRFAALPKSIRSSSIDALIHASFEGMRRQELNQAASHYCKSVLGAWR